MKTIQFILFLTIILSKFAIGQDSDCLGIDKNNILNKHESLFLTKQINNSFDFNNKKIAFYKSLVGYQSKQDFFKESKEFIKKGQTLSLQIIILTETEKNETRGFNAILVSWSKKTVTTKMRNKLIDELKKAST